MPEIKTDLIKGVEGEVYTFSSNEYIITPQHSIADVLRFCIEQTSISDVKYLVDEMVEED